jgi:hypothetical protein
MSGKSISRLDPAFAFILRKLREENVSLPEGKKMGLRAYCRKYGILVPEAWHDIHRREVPFSDLSGDEALDVSGYVGFCDPDSRDD